MEEFAIATRDAELGWKQIDLTDALPRWIASQRHAEGYFKRPEGMPEKRFVEAAAQDLCNELAASGPRDVVAVSGIGSLFGITPLSAILERVDKSVRGRLLICFPGTYERDFHRYRLLGAGEGWSYLAAPITAQRETLT
jgi:hypothetical protein